MPAPVRMPLPWKLPVHNYATRYATKSAASWPGPDVPRSPARPEKTPEGAQYPTMVMGSSTTSSTGSCSGLQLCLFCMWRRQLSLRGNDLPPCRDQGQPGSVQWYLRVLVCLSLMWRSRCVLVPKRRSQLTCGHSCGRSWYRLWWLGAGREHAAPRGTGRDRGLLEFVDLVEDAFALRAFEPFGRVGGFCGASTSRIGMAGRGI